MNIKRGRSRSFYIPTNSMSDVGFLLLIFIMLVALINYRVEVPIDFAEAQTALRTTAERNLEVWINRYGGIYLNGEPSDISAFEWKIAELQRDAPDTRVHIIADRNTPYMHVNAVLEIMQLLHYRVVSFVVRNAD